MHNKQTKIRLQQAADRKNPEHLDKVIKDIINTQPEKFHSAATLAERVFFDEPMHPEALIPRKAILRKVGAGPILHTMPVII